MHLDKGGVRIYAAQGVGDTDGSHRLKSAKTYQAAGGRIGWPRGGAPVACSPTKAASDWWRLALAVLTPERLRIGRKRLPFRDPLAPGLSSNLGATARPPTYS